jgi:hypothetical protein
MMTPYCPQSTWPCCCSSFNCSTCGYGTLTCRDKLNDRLWKAKIMNDARFKTWNFSIWIIIQNSCNQYDVLYMGDTMNLSADLAAKRQNH